MRRRWRLAWWATALLIVGLTGFVLGRCSGYGEGMQAAVEQLDEKNRVVGDQGVLP